MNKPGDFFVGIIELFAVLLPGGVLTFLLFQNYGLFLPELSDIKQEYYWIAFIFFAYLLGHLNFMLGSWLDIIYDMHRKRRDPYTNESAFQCASRIKHKIYSETECEAMNTYQWSISVLTTQYTEAMAEVNRLVANSKFFRSIVVITLLVSIVWASKQQYIHALLALVFAVPCYLRYYGQRLKSTTRAYQYIVMLNGIGKLSEAPHLKV